MVRKMLATGLALAVVLATGLVVGPPSCATATERSAAQVQTYTVRLEAYNVGTLVDSRVIPITASNELDFRNQVGNAQAAFGRDLNNRRLRWNRITFVLLSVN